MPAQHTRHVAPTEPLVQYVANQIASGRYVTAGEIIRAARRLPMELGGAKEHRSVLEAMLDV